MYQIEGKKSQKTKKLKEQKKNETRWVTIAVHNELCLLFMLHYHFFNNFSFRIVSHVHDLKYYCMI